MTDRLEGSLLKPSQLASLIYWLGIALRDLYGGHSRKEVNQLDRLEGINELLIICANQMRQELSGAQVGYPAAEFVGILRQRAMRGGCQELFDTVLSHATARAPDKPE